MPSGTHRIGELREGVEAEGLLVCERVAPGTAVSAGRVRRELTDVPAGLKVATDRLDDIALVVTEAATNVVLHAYPRGTGTRIVFSFRHATPIPQRSPAGHAAPAIGIAELLCDYARALIAASTALHADACALLAETRQALAHSRRHVKRI